MDKLHRTFYNIGNKLRNNPLYKGKSTNIKSVADLRKEVGKAPSEDHQLDRIDNSKGYTKGNLRWATRSENAVNRTNIPLSKSGAKGVYKRPNGKFYARVKRNQKIIKQKEFSTLAEANKWRKAQV